MAFGQETDSQTRRGQTDNISTEIPRLIIASCRSAGVARIPLLVFECISERS